MACCVRKIASSKAQLFIKGLISNQSVAAMFTTKEVDVSRNGQFQMQPSIIFKLPRKPLRKTLLLVKNKTDDCTIRSLTLWRRSKTPSERKIAYSRFSRNSFVFPCYFQESFKQFPCKTRFANSQNHSICLTASADSNYVRSIANFYGSRSAFSAYFCLVS